MGAGVDEGGQGRGGATAADRWLAARDRPRQVVCIGDSTSRTVDGELTWVDLLAVGLGAPGDPAPVEGFRGIWRTQEWSRHGSWRRTTPEDPFDAAPFGFGYVSSGDPADALTWTRPPGAPVAAFDVCTMVAPGLSRAQYRVDGGDWHPVDPPADDRPPLVLTRTAVRRPVHERVELRAGDGSRPAVVAAAGLDVYATDPDAARTRVHHLGIGMQNLEIFCRPSAGDPMALLDLLRPDLVVVGLTNDVMWHDPQLWQATLRRLWSRIEPYAELMLISLFDQRSPRRVDDAVTVAGSDRIRSRSASFVPSDITEVVRGTNIPADPETTIVSVPAGHEVVLSAAASATSDAGELVIGHGRDVEIQAAYRAATRQVAASLCCRYLDVHEAWRAQGAAGWDAAAEAGLMLDRNHATAEGHRDIAARVLDLLDRPVEPITSAGGVDLDAAAARPADLPEIVPGEGSVVAPSSGTVELRVPVRLSRASEGPVTVRWRTWLLDDAEFVQAPRDDYLPASGQLTFEAGQQDAWVAITVVANSTGVDEMIVVTFREPTGARVGGAWGLGFGIVRPLS